MKLLTLALSSLVLTGCVSNSTIKPGTPGVAVSIYEPASLQSVDHCEEMSLVYFDKSFGMATASVPPRYRRKVTNALYAAVKKRLQTVASIKTTTLRPDMSASAYHTMKIYVRDFSLSKENDGEYITRTALASVDIKLMRAADTCSVPAIELEEERQTPAWKERQVPSDAGMIALVADALAEDLIDQISPRRVDNYYRFLRTYTGTSNPAQLQLKNRQCQMATESLAREIAQKGESPDRLYHIGIAYECMATDAGKQSDSLHYSQKALAAYHKASQLAPSDSEIARAYLQSSATVSVLNTARANQRRSAKKLNDTFATSGSF